MEKEKCDGNQMDCAFYFYFFLLPSNIENPLPKRINRTTYYYGACDAKRIDTVNVCVCVFESTVSLFHFHLPNAAVVSANHFHLF